MTDTNRFYEEIYDYLKDITIIDTHEHIPTNEKYRDQDTDIIKEYLTYYFSSDLVSAGYKNFAYAVDTSQPIMDRWLDMEPYWNIARYTGYGRSLDYTAKLLYDIDQLNRDTIEEANKRYLAALHAGEHYQYVLKDVGHIAINIREISLPDLYDDIDTRYTNCAMRMDNFIYPKTGADLIAVEDFTGIRITCLADWLEACEYVLEDAFSRDYVVSLKTEAAYERSLYFDTVTYAEAEKEFSTIFHVGGQYCRADEVYAVGKNFQDYMMHFLCRWANKRGLPFQIHTGLQEGNSNNINNGDPTLLVNLFNQYKDVSFDVFHIGYPYQHKMSALAKVFPNIFVDLCWAHIISPTACINTICEWADAVPMNKFNGFGGDYCFVDGVAGHQLMARQNISRALGIKVAEGLFDVDEAKHIGKMMLYDTPKKLFHIKDKYAVL